MSDDDLDFGAPKSKHSARQGRRAAAAAPTADLDQDDDDLGPGAKSSSADGPPDRPNKAVSGWGEEAPRKPRSRQLGEGFEAIEEPGPAPKSSKANKGAWDPVEDIDKELDDFDLLFGLGDDLGTSNSPDLFRERLRPSSPAKDDDDSDNDIPVIPELEEQAEEDMSTRVATAPNVAVNRVATYRELDNDLLRQAAFQVLDNEIDLKLLTKSLSPMEDLIEDDRPWDWDRLFTEVSSELTTQWEKNAEGGETEQAET